MSLASLGLIILAGLVVLGVLALWADRLDIYPLDDDHRFYDPD